MTRQLVETVFRRFPFLDQHLAGCLGSAIKCPGRIYTTGFVLVGKDEIVLDSCANPLKEGRKNSGLVTSCISSGLIASREN